MSLLSLFNHNDCCALSVLLKNQSFKHFRYCRQFSLSIMDFFSKTEFNLDLVLRMSEKLGVEIPTLKLCIINSEKYHGSLLFFY